MTQKDIELNEAHRDRALAKLRKELTKDIDGAAEIARSRGLWEVLRLCYLMRLTRMTMVVPDYQQKLTHADLAGLQMRDEALKYAIALAGRAALQLLWGQHRLATRRQAACLRRLPSRRMGAHSTEAQTADYVRHRQAQRTEATR